MVYNSNFIPNKYKEILENLIYHLNIIQRLVSPNIWPPEWCNGSTALRILRKAYSHYLVRDVDQAEKSQRLALLMLKGFHSLSYEVSL